jgi:hypothetical protein
VIHERTFELLKFQHTPRPVPTLTPEQQILQRLTDELRGWWTAMIPTRFLVIYNG